MAWPRRVARAAVLLTGGALVAAGGLTAMAPSGSGLAMLALTLAVAVPSGLLGVAVSRRSGGQVVGCCLALLAFSVSTTIAVDAGARVLADRPAQAESLAWLVAVLAEGGWWIFVAVALLLLHFPDGRPPSRRWRWVPAVLVGCVAATQVYGALEAVPFRAPLDGLERPFGPPAPWFDVLSLVVFVAMLGLGLASAVSLVLRYRRSAPRQRRQIRWLAVGGVLIVAFPFLCLTEIVLWGRPGVLSAAVGIVGLVSIPVATGVAMLRHDLYDVDRLLAATVTWGLVTAAVLSLYAATAAATGVVLGRQSPVAAAVAAALGAVALAPLRNRVQARVDAKLYPVRRAAFEGIDALLGDIAAGRSVPEQLDGVLRTALRDPDLMVGFRSPDGGGYVTADGTALDVAGGVPVGPEETPVGMVVSGAEDLPVGLLRQVARRSTAVVEMVRLRLELASALREVESSRSRLVQIGYEERRRLERDLHDGAQQRLVSLGMAIRVAQRHLGDGTVDVDELLDECVAELGTAVAELRQLAHGIRPSSLDDGLPAAVARLVRNVPVAVDLRVEDSVLPDDVATTAYFVISEALANAVKHAQAQRIELQVQRNGAGILVRVSDDGCGGASLSPESGLADRVAALGGSLRVASPVGQGTTVEAELPCAS